MLVEWSLRMEEDPTISRASVGSLASQSCCSRLFSNHIRRSPSSGLSSPVFMSKLRGDHLNDKISQPAASELRVVGLLCPSSVLHIYISYFSLLVNAGPVLLLIRQNSELQPNKKYFFPPES